MHTKPYTLNQIFTAHCSRLKSFLYPQLVQCLLVAAGIGVVLGERGGEVVVA